MEAECDRDSPPPVPVIDLFAGPGGLGEGFATVAGPSGDRAFDIRLSIEKDPAAHRTLLLRTFLRQFPLDEVPDEYYRYVGGEITRDALFEAHPGEARRAEEEAWCAELGMVDHAKVRARIAAALGPSPGPWVLIGGPPCQAYSRAGRSRILGELRKRQNAEVTTGDRDAEDVDPESDFDRDHRHFLYQEYLRIIADHGPAVFVMENVPGILNSKLKGKPVIGRILRDLRDPIRVLSPEERPEGEKDLRYNIITLTSDSLFADGKPDSLQSFVLDASEHGVPQARKRVLIVGVRSDCEFGGWPRPVRRRTRSVTVREAIGDLPKLRSALSRRADSASARTSVIASAIDAPWFGGLERRIQSAMRNAVRKIQNGLGELPVASSSSVDRDVRESAFLDWCRDGRLNRTLNHEARSHMDSDLHRYLFVSAFGKVNGVSPRLRHFPKGLLPNHASAQAEGRGKSASFADRFRVQLGGEPSTTVVSHISRDGHYYIHYDPGQCRSLTVREAARLQSFPDNYFFEGSRTDQYRQVGNAVPPLLAHEVGLTVLSFVKTLRPKRVKDPREVAVNAVGA